MNISLFNLFLQHIQATCRHMMHNTLLFLSHIPLDASLNPLQTDKYTHIFT